MDVSRVANPPPGASRAATSVRLDCLTPHARRDDAAATLTAQIAAFAQTISVYESRASTTPLGDAGLSFPSKSFIPLASSRVR